MFRPRIIPVLLLKNLALVKSVKFKNYDYIGDPINAVRIFNDLKADELVFLDIDASKEKRLISLEFVRDVGEEANMPFAVGGGIRSLEDIEKIIKAGAEKVVINTAAALDPDFIKNASDTFGSSTIVVCIDVKKKLFKGEQTWINSGQKSTGYSPQEFAQLMEAKGAGELIVQSIEKDGSMSGYDLALLKSISTSVDIPVVALGGAGKLSDLQDAYHNAYVNGLAAGSLFVYHGSNKGVLINYPEKNEVQF
ncbi:MAG: imidazole glycerol phosphate synthase subunit HisF [Chitinophagales bacterium]|nr:imidazole glycerol phosphate synthase subunit HisF [Chitinophagales bacterium]